MIIMNINALAQMNIRACHSGLGHLPNNSLLPNIRLSVFKEFWVRVARNPARENPETKICNGYVFFHPLQRLRKSNRRKISGAAKNLWKVINFSGDIPVARMRYVVWKIRPCQHVCIQKLTFPLTLNQTLLVEANRSREIREISMREAKAAENGKA